VLLIGTTDVVLRPGARGVLVCGKSWDPQGFRKGCFGLWQTYGFKPLVDGLLTAGAGVDRDRGAAGAAVAAAVGEAVVLSAEGVGAAGLAGSGAVRAGLGEERFGVVSGAKDLAGERANGASASGMSGGAETWHGFSGS
jgi:hypothetical protein